MKVTIGKILLICLISMSANAQKWENLLDENLSKWEVWTGVPHKSVKNLPDGVKGVNNVMKEGKPIGLGDPMGIYKVEKDKKGNPVIHISGEIYAGLTTLKSYKDYHLTLWVKWGEKKWAPRLDKKRDNGLLYHCFGNHGSFWKVWMSCLELQIQEGDMGDLYALAGAKAKVRYDETNHWDPEGKEKVGTTKRSIDAEKEHGAWNKIDLYVLGDKAIHVVNGTVVLALTDAKKKDGTILDSGKIQIQSEGAECFVKDVKIKTIKKFPKKIRKKAKF
ncbi:3-keto-disaccharide hydrolase [Wenyingzhuangia sp. IMCC45574]